MRRGERQKGEREARMSWEENYRCRRPCPCGKGEYEEVHRSDDWGQHETSREMLCPRCKKLYAWDGTVVHGHPGDYIERGWVLKSTLKAERERRTDTVKKAKDLYYGRWRQRFRGLRTKKAIWSALTLNGKHYPSLGTFYQHTKGMSPEQVMAYVDKFFRFRGLPQVSEVIGVRPDWKALGLEPSEFERLVRLGN